MINLLSPTAKEQLTYARRNRQTRNMLVVAITAIILMTGVFGVSLYELGAMTDAAARSTAEKQSIINSRSADLAVARDAAKRLQAVKQVQANQTHFFELLNDLAAITPNGIYIESLTLTGDDKKPVRISVVSETYESMLEYRDILAGSNSVSGVDMENIGDNVGSYRASMVVGFRVGATR